MPFTVDEKADSRTITSGANPAVELRYVITGVGSDPAKTDDEEALEALQATAPATFLGLPQRDVRIEPLAVTDGQESVWNGEATYAPVVVEFGPAPPAQGQPTFSFDTGGGTQHITHSRQTVASFAPIGQTAPDYKGAIGVTPDRVEGVDIVVPVYQFTETHVLSDAVVTDAYKGVLMALTGTVNADFFKGFNPGEVLFLGATGAKRGDGDWEITYRFAASPNRSNITIGDISGISKNGWEYLWVRYEDVEDTAAEAIVKRPVAAYVEQVYDVQLFSQLGI